MRSAFSLVCVAVCVLAARPALAVWTLGVKGGVNMGDLSGDQAPGDSSMRTGFAGGTFAGFEVNGRFGIRGEVLYIQKGAEGSFVIPGDDHAHESVIKLDYVEVPVLFTAKFPAGEEFVFSLFAGPTLSFNTTAEVEVPGHNETVELDDVESFEIGGAVGGGVEYLLSSFSILADVRYGIGATSAVQDVDGQSFDVKNRGIAIMGGLAIPMGR